MAELYDTVTPYTNKGTIQAADEVEGVALLDHAIMYGLTKEELERMSPGQIAILQVSNLL